MTSKRRYREERQAVADAEFFGRIKETVSAIVDDGFGIGSPYEPLELLGDYVECLRREFADIDARCDAAIAGHVQWTLADFAELGIDNFQTDSETTGVSAR